MSTEPETDAALPLREDPSAMTIVGLGASAGGIQALQAFFENAPADSGMAFVVVLHLSPEHESLLADLLGRHTAMPVSQVNESVRLEPNRVYVIPPNASLAMDDGHVLLSEPELPRVGRRVAIDRFFRSLAAAQGPQAAVVVLSGTGSDGALGLKLVKEYGGLTVAQEPGDAEHDGMPRNAIGTGMVDYVLPARDMAAQIIAYRDASRRMRLPAEAAPAPEQRDDGQEAEAAVREILAHVRAQSGHDFSHYKRATVLRRIGRRLQVNGQEDLPSYLDFLRRHPAEVGSLVGDLLISVTQFFRDPDAWAALDRDVIPRLLEDREPGDPVRAWVCGCATGEEAYSLAILLLEQAGQKERPPQVQVFATDMDVDAIAHAREGSYLENAAADIAPERLRRWFYQENGRYRVRKEVRESVLFAAHDVLHDTPFSRLDLVTCRNLLIYLDRTAQERAFATFHFALRPDGRLFLGSAESADGGNSHLFGATDKQHRLYVRRPVARPAPPPLPLLGTPAAARPPAAALMLALTPPGSLGRVPLEGRRGAGQEAEGSDSAPGDRPDRPGRPPGSGDLHRGLLELYAPPSVLVSEDYEILHLSDRAGRFLRLAGGEPTTNLLRIIHPDLRFALRAALYAASAGDGGDETRLVPAAAVGDGPPQPVRLVVRPVREPEAARGYCLVFFEVLPPGDATHGERGEAGAAAPPAGETEVAHRLEEEITRLQAQLGSAIEQYEASIEEMKASNEELQAINEELRSATEELETSREELQSVNEELSTVNVELRGRVEEVSRANADLQNLLASTDIATLFLDRGLQIQRYTPAAESLFNIIPTDVGRPFAHLTHRLDYDAVPDAERVLGRLAVVEREVRSADGREFLARLLPYRTLEDKIDGVVLSFVDVTALRRAEAALLVANEELEGRVVERTLELADANERRVEFLRLLLATQEEERRRVSRELHDQTGQELTALLLGIKALEDSGSLTPEDEEAATRLRSIADALARNIHRLAVELRPTALDDVGLPDALANYVEEWSGRSGIPTDFEGVGFSEEGGRLPAEVETTVYRVVQEALTNVTRHATGVSRVSVVLQRLPGEVVASVEDDGAGFDGAAGDAAEQGTTGDAARRRLGLAGMRERAALASGTLTIESAPRKGTTIYLRIPAPSEAPAAS